MSEFNVFLSNKDKNCLRALALSIKDNFANSIHLTSILNCIAVSLGYPNWKELNSFNISDVLFSDISVILRTAIPKTMVLLEEKFKLTCSSDAVFRQFSCDPVWKEVGGDVAGNVVNFCLIPVGEKGEYALVGFTSELDLVHRLEAFYSSDVVLEPRMKIDEKFVKNRNRTYESRRPILKYLEQYEGIVFIELSTKICQFRYISFCSIDIRSEDIQSAMVRSSFYNPSSYAYRFTFENDCFSVRVYRENFEDVNITLAGVIEADKQNRSILKARAHPEESYSCVEDTFTLSALKDKFEPRVSRAYSYFDFCRLILATISGCKLISNDLKDVSALLNGE